VWLFAGIVRDRMLTKVKATFDEFGAGVPNQHLIGACSSNQCVSTKRGRGNDFW
jgi:hypothetical protein